MNSIAYFAPAIIQALGYGSIRTQLLSVPPWVCAFVFAMIVATLSDRIRHRFSFTLICSSIAIVGFAILFKVHNKPHLQYGALFLAASGAYTSMPVIVCWFATNRKCATLIHERALTSGAVGGHKRRAVGTGWQVGFGNSKSLEFVL